MGKEDTRNYLIGLRACWKSRKMPCNSVWHHNSCLFSLKQKNGVSKPTLLHMEIDKTGASTGHLSSWCHHDYILKQFSSTTTIFLLQWYSTQTQLSWAYMRCCNGIMTFANQSPVHQYALPNICSQVFHITVLGWGNKRASWRLSFSTYLMGKPQLGSHQIVKRQRNQQIRQSNGFVFILICIHHSPNWHSLYKTFYLSCMDMAQ